MTFIFLQTVLVGTYVMRQRLAGRKRYPLVPTLEPLFRCNWRVPAAVGHHYPDEILNKRNLPLADAPHCRVDGARRAGGAHCWRRAVAP